MKAIFKFNNGISALLCSDCRTIIKTGDQFNSKEWRALRGENHMPPRYCNECKKSFD